MIPALIGAGASLLGGIFQSSSQRKAERRAQENRLNEFSDLRIAAERGNVNFLTALAAGGLRQSVPVFTSPIGQTISEIGGIMAEGYARRAAEQQTRREQTATKAAQEQQVRAVQRAAVSSPQALTEDYTQFVEAVSAPLQRGIRVIMPTGHVATVNRFALPTQMRAELGNRMMTQTEYSQIFGFEAGESLMSQNPGRVSRATGVPSPAEQYDATQTDWGGAYSRTVRPVQTIGQEAARIDRTLGSHFWPYFQRANETWNPFTRLRQRLAQ